jgi:predicted nucleic acid-binding protein
MIVPSILPGGYLLDTNAVSEPACQRPNLAVMTLLNSISASTYLSVLTLGELRRGDAKKRRKHPKMTSRYTAWIDGLEAAYIGRVLPIDLATATLWGQLSADRTRPIIDTFLVATAIVHGLTLVTRNTKDVADLPVKLLNPWQS